jgi:RNA polymerase sigma factor (TIGR02999 family)
MVNPRREHGFPKRPGDFNIAALEACGQMEADMSQVTLLGAKAGQGDCEAAAELLRLVYGELRRLAAAQMARERAGQTLQPTALVHEAWLRLGGDQQPAWENRAHFFGAAAEAMRRILVDRARRRNAQRRGGGRTHVPLDEIEIGGAANDPHLLEINEALERFAEREPQKAEFIRLRYFIGLQLGEAARVLGISEATAKRWWVFARAWLYRELNPDV